MQEKFLNDSIIGNKNMVASYNKKGELLRLFYPNTDYRQFVDFFRTGLKINDSALIYLHEDANNTYQQYYTENTNILNTEINNTYFHLRTLQTDFASTNENILVKRYTFINENTIDLTVKFLIHSSLLTDDNNMMSCIIKNDCMTQYCHDYLFHTFSKEKIESYQINDSIQNIGSGTIGDKDYIGMSNDSSICYSVGTIKPGESKSIDILITIEDNKEKTSRIESENTIERLKKIDIEKEETITKKYWKKYVNDHKTITFPVQTVMDKKVDAIYTRTILLFPLLANNETGGISAAIEIDEKRQKSGRYSYCWPRDAVFITKALDILGMTKETEKFYKHFCKMTQSKNGMWEQRFYTDGRLAPCWGYQIDETASVVYGIYQHYQKTKDKKFLKENLKMCENAIKFLEKYMDDITSDQPKMQISYDLWEMSEGIHLYSLASIFASFRSMIEIYKQVKELFENNRLKQDNILQETQKLEQYVASVKKYVQDHFVDQSKNIYVRNEKDQRLDVSVIGSVTPFAMFTPKEKRITNTIEAINLTLRTYTGGYLRFEQDSYLGGKSPWPVTTLWMALYYIENGEYKKARECFEFVVQTATKHGFLGEQVDNNTMQTNWVVGLGWSHAMFILVLDKLMSHGK